ncbi:MAG: S46 family peptidase [Bryobacterales bacterium]|nr:S46 family peptidase [Bryobacterales bacterium]
MTRRFLALALAVASLGLADEGMWLVNNFPREAVRATHGVEVTDGFLQRVQRASVRFNNGGSASFVSPRGLLFTNHHVGRDCIHKLSSAENDYIARGFQAKSLAEEKACPDLEINILHTIKPVTAEVKAVEKPGMSPAEMNAARREEMARLEKECATRTGNRCDVVTLYSGGRYDLYEYKKFTDVRLVFAPEEAIAAFGGDPDNFTYPRYCLDFALFRAYDNGRPVDSRDYFRWSRGGARDGELIFVPGNPGTTARLDTLAQLEFSRDISYPLLHERLDSMVRMLLDFGVRSEENKRVANAPLLSAQNSFKAYTGFLRGLRDARLMARKRDEEQTLRAKVMSDEAMRKEFGSVWDDVASAYAAYREYFVEYSLSTPALSDLFGIARHVLRLPEEMTKPGGQRLREYRDSNLPAIEQALYSPAPIHKDLEVAILAENLRFLRAKLGASHPLVQAALAGKTPEAAAADAVGSTKLIDISERKRLAADAAAVRASSDGMLVLARAFEEHNRKFRKRLEDELQAVLALSASKIARAKFGTEGESSYPDATFTFRVAFGPVRGFEAEGRTIPYTTVTQGVYGRATGTDPFRLPESWLSARPKLNPKTSFNFVSTADIHGGNSGSPTLNAKGEIVGIVFDGNLDSLPNRFVYTDGTARAVHVSSQIVIESLDKVYGAKALVKELRGR